MDGIGWNWWFIFNLSSYSLAPSKKQGRTPRQSDKVGDGEHREKEDEERVDRRRGRESWQVREVDGAMGEKKVGGRGWRGEERRKTGESWLSRGVLEAGRCCSGGGHEEPEVVEGLVDV